jgi:hypothetical protein
MEKSLYGCLIAGFRRRDDLGHGDYGLQQGG